MSRKLVTLRLVDELLPIDGADFIEVAVFGGWKVIVKKGEFTVGKTALFHEIDSLVPLDHAAYSFLTKNVLLVEQEDGTSKQYARIKSMKMKGVVSQGLALPLTSLTPGQLVRLATLCENKTKEEVEDTDFTEVMDVLKYESVAEKVSGNGNTARISTFPSFIPKTDQERVQNINLKRLPEGETYEVTMKLDGSSMTVWCKDGEIGVASRNQTVYDGTSEAQGHFALTAIKSGALQALIDYYDTTGQSLAIQGEVMGPGIQQNQEELQEHEFFVFDIFNIDTQNYLLPAFRQVFVEEFGLKHVPVLAEARQILAGATHDMILSDAEGPSLNPKKQREGVVYKANGRDRYGHIPHFKAISNKWLLKNE